MKVEQLNPEVLLRNCHRLGASKYRRSPLWVFVRDFCGVGRTTARELCTQLGWDPDERAPEPLPKIGQ